MWQTAKTLPVIPETVVSCFLQYMEYEEHQISRAEFEMNLFEKLDDSRFLDDISPLLTGSSWDSRAAARYVLDSLAPLMPGDAWQKTKEKMIILQKR